MAYAKKFPIELLFFLAFASYLCLWLLAHPFFSARALGNALGAAGFFGFSLSLLLSSRWPKIEDWIGGLDRLYHLHRLLGIWSFGLTIGHPLILALHWLPDHFDKFIQFTLPFHKSLFINLGSIAFWMMILILGVTLLKLLPYDKWKIVHKFMSAVFVLAAFHILLFYSKLGFHLGQFLLFLPIGIGFFGIVYKQIFIPFLMVKPTVKIVSAKPINDNVTEISLAPLTPLQFIPGQYGFFSFEGPALTKESHPFTLIGTPEDATLAIYAKIRGDFTKQLYRHINADYIAKFEGPYGRLDFTQGQNEQIWIAGGIGIVLFLAWSKVIQKQKDLKRAIDLYYCVHRRSDAIFFEEFQKINQCNPSFRCFLQCSEDSNRLTIDEILRKSGPLRGKTIYMCGPKKLTRNFEKEFRNCGVQRENIEFEDFDFF